MVVGLGNPGRKYERTRHNIGFQVIEEMSKRFGGGYPRARFQGETVEIEVDGIKLLLLRPHTYMNRSGESVLPARDFYKLGPADLMVVCDDINLPLGRLRIRSKGSSGGQKGLADIGRRLGTDEYPRLRLGIGAPPPGWDCADYVLGRFTAEEAVVVEESVQRAVEALRVWARDGIEKAMSQFNGN